MPIDLTTALAGPPTQAKISWQPDDVLLYHLAIGAGVPPTDSGELRYVTEPDPVVLPSFAVVAPSLRTTAPPSMTWPGIDIDLRKILHGSQRVEVHRPLPPAAEAVAASRIAAVQDKGSAAVLVLETEVTGTGGEPLWTATSRIFARGEGGFGGERGGSVAIRAPERAPDAVFETATLPQQALLYRLLGDRNPLHSDPGVAIASGFPRPILHGLCTYGMVLKGAVAELLGGEPAAVLAYEGVFTGVVFPGETLRTAAWHEAGAIILSSAVTSPEAERDGAPVLSAEITRG
jgi:acyl dehydratase